MSPRLTTKKPLGFLDLPAELRLDIYTLLLTPHEYVDPATPDIWCPPHRVFPAILATCRLIAREASPLLYNAYPFSFALPSTSSQTPASLHDGSLQQQQHDPSTSREEACLPTAAAAANFDLAAFVRRIGSPNAAQIRALTLTASSDPRAVAAHLPRCTALISTALPGLRHLTLHLHETDASLLPDKYAEPGLGVPEMMMMMDAQHLLEEEEEEEEGARWPGACGWLAAGGGGDVGGLEGDDDAAKEDEDEEGFYPMYAAVRELVARVSWLHRFEYAGREEFGGVDRGEERGVRKLWGLERVVERRRAGGSLEG